MNKAHSFSPFVILLFILIHFQCSLAAVYYVSPDGSDSASGAATAPWLTPQKAATTAKAGDTIWLREGTYRPTDYVGACVNFTHSGTSMELIKMAGYPGETVVLSGMFDRSDPSFWISYQNDIYYTTSLGGSGFDGKIPVVVQDERVMEPKSSLNKLKERGETFFDKSKGRLYVISFAGGNPGNYQTEVSQSDSIFRFDENDQHIILENMTLTGAYYGIRCVPHGAHRTFRNLTLKHFKADAIKFNTTGNRNDLVENCKFSSFGDFGIDTYGSSNQTFRNNEFTGVHAWQSGGAIKSLADGNHHLIDGNYVHDLGGRGWEAAFELREAEHIQVVNNLVVNSVGGAVYLYGNNDISTPVPDPTVIGVKIINNTIFNTNYSAIWLMRPCQDTIIRNNIIVQLAGGSYCLRVDPGGQPGFNTSHNDLYREGGFPIKWLGTSYTVSDYQASTQHDHGSFSEDPRFVNRETLNFRLSPDSPAIDRGDFEDAPAHDMALISRPQGFGIDLGAYELATGQVDTTAPTIQILSPESSELTTNSPTMNVSGTASDDSGLLQISWSTDRGQSGYATGVDYWVIHDLPLLSGANLITITAQDMAGNQGLATLTAHYQAETEPDPEPDPEPEGPAETITLQITSADGDAQENLSTGNVLYEKDKQYVGKGFIKGFRFTNVPIPRGAVIRQAHLEINCLNYCRKPIVVQYFGEAADNALPYTSQAQDLSSRTVTVANVADEADNWTEGEYNSSPDISGIIQEIIAQPGWLGGNALSIFIEDVYSSSRRIIHTYDGNPSVAARLKVTYHTP